MGANPLNTLKIAECVRRAGRFLLRCAAQSGKRIICIDPMRSETTDFFGDSAEWIAPHLGTDVAMMLGIAHTGGERLARHGISGALYHGVR